MNDEHNRHKMPSAKRLRQKRTATRCLLQLPEDVLTLLVSEHGAINLFGTNKYLSHIVCKVTKSAVTDSALVFDPSIWGECRIQCTINIFPRLTAQIEIISRDGIRVHSFAFCGDLLRIFTISSYALMIGTPFGFICGSCGTCTLYGDNTVYCLPNMRLEARGCPFGCIREYSAKRKVQYVSDVAAIKSRLAQTVYLSPQSRGLLFSQLASLYLPIIDASSDHSFVRSIIALDENTLFTNIVEAKYTF